MDSVSLQYDLSQPHATCGRPQIVDPANCKDQKNAGGTFDMFDAKLGEGRCDSTRCAAETCMRRTGARPLAH
eukprot:2903362-Pleurochrysis_carterae.AAC.1